jgi:hypothetical protein
MRRAAHCWFAKIGIIVADFETADARDLMRRWVDTWRRAGVELELIRRGEIAAIDTQEAVRQLFGSSSAWTGSPAHKTSGLVEQQAWFAKLRK